MQYFKLLQCDKIITIREHIFQYPAYKYFDIYVAYRDI